MNNNLFIKESWVNETEHYRSGNSDWYETFTDNIKTLFKFLQKEYGKATKMYVDTEDGKAKQTGWVFSKKQKYEDTKETFIQSTWVEVSTTEPYKECNTLNINYPFTN